MIGWSTSSRAPPPSEFAMKILKSDPSRSETKIIRSPSGDQSG
jgi:hypothetical protein